MTSGPLEPDGYGRDPVLPPEAFSPSTLQINLGTKTVFHCLVPRGEVWVGDGKSYTMQSFGADEMSALPRCTESLRLATSKNRCWSDIRYQLPC